MRYAVVGAGATGGFVGGLLARSGADVTLIARGPHLEAMRARGLTVRDGSGEWVVRPRCTDVLEAVREAEMVLLTVKAHSLSALAPRIGPLLAPGAVVVTAQNGIPWWYFDRHGGPLEGTRLRSVDPDGAIERSLETARVIGCVVWPATRLAAPGIIEHVEGLRFAVGEPDGARSERVTALASDLTSAGLKARVSRRIRHEIWLKLIGNVAMNPLSALTRATLARIAALPETRAVARAIMSEAASVAAGLGIELEISVDQRLAGAEGVGEHKASMLQDVESGRAMEVEALVGAVVELAELVAVPCPHLCTVYACARLLNETVA